MKFFYNKDNGLVAVSRVTDIEIELERTHSYIIFNLDTQKSVVWSFDTEAQLESTLEEIVTCRGIVDIGT